MAKKIYLCRMEKPRIIFLGTPEFAVPSLRILIEAGHNVVAVVTTPDKPAGRGQKLHESDVKIAARELGLPILQPEKLRDPEFLDALRDLKPDLGIVIAFRMLPEVMWSMPRLGTFNLHASLLPQYRGAAPINWAIINGETTTGVTTFMLNEEIDKGAILEQVKIPIGPMETVGELYDVLKTEGAKAVLRTVERLSRGDIIPIEQPETGELKPAPKIHKDTCRIDWTWDGKRIVDFVRGLSPYPAAWMQWDEDVTAKVFEVEFVTGGAAASCGVKDTDGRTYLYVRCANGWISIRSLQLAGKKRMPIRDFLAGNSV